MLFGREFFPAKITFFWLKNREVLRFVSLRA
jgi:hypothetical protein